MTPDLQRLQQSSDTLGPIIAQLELELVDDPHWGAPSDTSYLTEKDRANPDILANVEAMAETNKLISWFGRDAEGYVGMWHGPAQRPIETAPVVRLDTEGQYSIVAASIPDYIAMSVPEDEFATVRDALVGAGFQVGNNPDAIWDALGELDDDPNEYRDALYRQHKARLGGGPGDDEDLGDEEDEREPASRAEDDEDLGPEEQTERDDGDDGSGGAADEGPSFFDVDEEEDGGAAPAARGGDDDEDLGPEEPAAREEEEEDGGGEAVQRGDDDDEDAADEEGEEEEAPAPAKKPAKKAPAKKPAAKKPAKKPAKKAPAKKPAKKPAAKKPAKKAPAKKPAAKKPAKKKR